MKQGPFLGIAFFMIFLLFCQQVDKGERVEQWKKLVQDVVYIYIRIYMMLSSMSIIHGHWESSITNEYNE